MPLAFTHRFALAKDKWDGVTVTVRPPVCWAAGVMISDLADMERWVNPTGRVQPAAPRPTRPVGLHSYGREGLAFGLGVANSIIRELTQILDPGHVAYPTDPAHKDSAK